MITLGIISIYIYRIILYGGFYVITYIIGLLSLHFTLQLFLPVGIPDIDEDEASQIMELPTNLKFLHIILKFISEEVDLGEYKPIIRIYSEFKFW